MPIPTPDELFGPGDAVANQMPSQPTRRWNHPGPPTPDELFGPDKPLDGPVHDGIFGSIKTHVGRVLSAIGQGVSDEWGGEPVGLDEQSEKALRKNGWYADYQDAMNEFYKAANASWLRPVVQLGSFLSPSAPLQERIAGLGVAESLAVHAPGAVSRAAEAGLVQTGQEIAGQGGIQLNEYGFPVGTRSLLGLPFAMAGELASSVYKGYLPELGEYEGAAGAVNRAVRDAGRQATLDKLNAARSVAGVAETEAAYHGAAPLTPQTAEARIAAAKEAGVEPTPPVPPPPDLDTLARRLDPDTFEVYDRAAAEKQRQREIIADLRNQRETSPEAIDAQVRIQTILGKVNGVESRLTNAARQRLADAQADLEAALSEDRPEIAQQVADARDKLMEADFTMREHAVAVSDAYRRAREMSPALPAADPSPVPLPVDTAQHLPTDVGAAEAEAKATAAAGSSKEAQKGVAPARVTGEETLGEPSGEAEELAARLAKHETLTPEVAMEEARKLIAERKPKQPATSNIGFNGLYDAQGKPVRFKNDEKWTPGAKVDVGMVKGLTVEGVQPPTEGREPAFVVSSDKGQVYTFVPGKGLTRLEGETATAALREARGPDLQPAVEHPPGTPEEAVRAAQVAAAEKVTPQAAQEGEPTPVAAAPPQEPAPARAEGTTTLPEQQGLGELREVQGTGERVTRGLAQHVEDAAIAHELTLGFGDLPEYDRLSVEGQAKLATQLMNTDYEFAKSVAMGRRAPPNGLLPESAFVAVEKRATAVGDVATLRELATQSRLLTSATEMGRRIRILAERGLTDSPVRMIQVLQEARENVAAKKLATADAEGVVAKVGENWNIEATPAAKAKLAEAKQAVINEIKAKVRQDADVAKPGAWEAFLNTIKCQ